MRPRGSRCLRRLKTPKPIVDKLSAEIAKVVATPAFQKKAEEQGATADYQTPAQLDAKVKKESEDVAAVVKAAKIEADSTARRPPWLATGIDAANGAACPARSSLMP